jgi:hypothetical protein
VTDFLVLKGGWCRLGTARWWWSPIDDRLLVPHALSTMPLVLPVVPQKLHVLFANYTPGVPSGFLFLMGNDLCIKVMHAAFFIKILLQSIYYKL